MKKFLYPLLVVVLIASAAMMASPAGATAPCNTYHVKLLNDGDSKVGGGNWALDTIDRSVEVCGSDGSYTFTATDTGTFVTYAGGSPDASGTVGAGVTGNLNGGYTLSVQGTINPATPADLGTVDLQCDQVGNCVSSFSTLSTIFSTVNSYDYKDWGWTYNTCDNAQTWVNSQSGNSGDITASVANCPVAQPEVKNYYRCPEAFAKGDWKFLLNPTHRFCVDYWEKGYFWSHVKSPHFPKLHAKGN